MKLADFTCENIIRKSVNVEAGYVNNPADKGGETNWGITYATAQEHKADLIKLFKWDGAMRNLTQPMAMWVYRHSWWDRLRCDELLAVHPFIADRIFDFGINAGRGAAGTNLQRILNVMNRMGKERRNVFKQGKVF